MNQVEKNLFGDQPIDSDDDELEQIIQQNCVKSDDHEGQHQSCQSSKKKP